MGGPEPVNKCRENSKINLEFDETKQKVVIRMLEKTDANSIRAAMIAINKQDDCNPVYAEPLLAAASRVKTINPGLYIDIIIFLFNMKEREVPFSDGQKAKLRDSFPWMQNVTKIGDNYFDISGKDLKLDNTYILNDGTVRFSKLGFTTLAGTSPIINGVKIIGDTELSLGKTFLVDSGTQTLTATKDCLLEFLPGNKFVPVFAKQRFALQAGPVKVDGSKAIPQISFFTDIRAHLYNGKGFFGGFSGFRDTINLETKGKPMFDSGAPVMVSFKLVNRNNLLRPIDFDNEDMPRTCVFNYDKNGKLTVEFKDAPVKKIDYYNQNKRCSSCALEGRIPNTNDILTLVKAINSLPEAFCKNISSVLVGEESGTVVLRPKKNIDFSFTEGGRLDREKIGGKITHQKITLPKFFGPGIFYVLAALALLSELETKKAGLEKEWREAAQDVYGKFSKKDKKGNANWNDPGIEENQPGQGCVNAMACADFTDDVARTYAKAMTNPAFFSGLTDPRYRQKLDLLMKYGFFTEEQYGKIISGRKPVDFPQALITD